MSKAKKTKEVKTQQNVTNVIEEILRGDESEVEVLRKYRLSPEAFNRLLNNPDFVTQISNQIGFSIIRSKLLIAQYAQVATAKLISMTSSEKEETARKACLDVITLAQKQSEPTLQKEEVSEIINSANQPITDEQASKMLAVLAGDSDGQDE